MYEMNEWQLLTVNIFLLNVVLVHFLFFILHQVREVQGSRAFHLFARRSYNSQLSTRSLCFLSVSVSILCFFRQRRCCFSSLCLRHDVRKVCWARFCCPDSVSDAPFRHRTLKPAPSPAGSQKLPTALITVSWGTGRNQRLRPRPSPSTPIFSIPFSFWCPLPVTSDEPSDGFGPVLPFEMWLHAACLCVKAALQKKSTLCICFTYQEEPDELWHEKIGFVVRMLNSTAYILHLMMNKHTLVLLSKKSNHFF